MEPLELPRRGATWRDGAKIDPDRPRYSGANRVVQEHGAFWLRKLGRLTSSKKATKSYEKLQKYLWHGRTMCLDCNTWICMKTPNRLILASALAAQEPIIRARSDTISTGLQPIVSPLARSQEKKQEEKKWRECKEAAGKFNKHFWLQSLSPAACTDYTVPIVLACAVSGPFGLYLHVSPLSQATPWRAPAEVAEGPVRSLKAPCVQLYPIPRYSCGRVEEKC
ncbi:hypothetical protein BGZ61DRAFT_459678 [Ilyonectria robusta]|uniref:uncharacterized protein n=1 Tax=Ilyonectria robusta TaxID=1079257 RepID=UPI001E8D899E|nr:uncharacterized protein BGZ61DRAFT_459678 [Ilyonectria robusta]KAH8670617.1 hypothetical protein BGZ61DRAFT_459678 [Ilyonectria robusta]